MCIDLCVCVCVFIYVYMCNSIGYMVGSVVFIFMFGVCVCPILTECLRFCRILALRRVCVLLIPIGCLRGGGLPEASGSLLTSWGLVEPLWASWRPPGTASLEPPWGFQEPSGAPPASCRLLGLLEPPGASWGLQGPLGAVIIISLASASASMIDNMYEIHKM